MTVSPAITFSHRTDAVLSVSVHFILEGGTAMLTDYIEMYKKAIAENDKKTMRRIERELATLGMDVCTLKMLAKSI